jgi:tetratricopeptide (TPR) repeat protein
MAKKQHADFNAKQMRKINQLLKHSNDRLLIMGDTPSIENATEMMKLGNHHQVVEICSILLEQKPRNIKFLTLRAEAYRCLGQYELTLNDQNTIARIKPSDPSVLIARIETKRHLGDYMGGLEDANKAIRINKSSSQSWVAHSECSRSIGNFSIAIRSASQAIKHDPKWSWPYIVRAKAKRQAGDVSGAIADTLIAEKITVDAYAFGWRSEFIRKSGDVIAALKEIDSALVLRPSISWFWALKAQIQCELGQHREAIDSMQKAVKLDPHCSCEHDFIGHKNSKTQEDPQLAWVFAWRGGVRRAKNIVIPALEDLQLAVNLDPKSFWISAWFGEALSFSGQLAKGIKYLEKSIDQYHGYAQAWFWLGQAQLNHGNSEEAFNSFIAGLKIEPENVSAILGMAAYYKQKGNNAEALKLLRKAQKLAPALFSNK